MKNEAIELQIEGLIYQIRGERVLLDQDIAQLYDVETRTLIQSMKRNISRFPKDFMFQLSEEEFASLRSQIVISKGKGGRRTPPYAFTEQGIAMLSSTLRSQRAIHVNIQIMRTFVRLRRMIESHAELAEKLFNLKARHEQKFQLIFDMIKELTKEESTTKKHKIGFGN